VKSVFLKSLTTGVLSLLVMKYRIDDGINKQLGFL
jgi:hypothetical protein